MSCSHVSSSLGSKVVEFDSRHSGVDSTDNSLRNLRVATFFVSRVLAVSPHLDETAYLEGIQMVHIETIAELGDSCGAEQEEQSKTDDVSTRFFLRIFVNLLLHSVLGGLGCSVRSRLTSYRLLRALSFHHATRTTTRRRKAIESQNLCAL